MIFDTAYYPLLCPERPLSLRSLVQQHLGVCDFQSGSHDSVEDARAVLALCKKLRLPPVASSPSHSPAHAPNATSLPSGSEMDMSVDLYDTCCPHWAATHLHNTTHSGLLSPQHQCHQPQRHLIHPQHPPLSALPTHSTLKHTRAWGAPREPSHAHGMGIIGDSRSHSSLPAVASHAASAIAGPTNTSINGWNVWGNGYMGMGPSVVM